MNLIGMRTTCSLVVRLIAHMNRAKVVIYDLEKNVRFTLTQDWDRSPDTITVCVLIHIVRLILSKALVVFVRRHRIVPYSW